MVADGADFRRGGADVDMAAVAAFPAVFAGADPDFSGFDVGEELAVAFLVALLDGGDALELGGDVVETSARASSAKRLYMSVHSSRSPSAAAFRFSTVEPMPPRCLNQSLACSFSLSAVSRKNAAICS